MQVIHEEGKRPIKIWTDTVEDSAMAQLRNLSGLPFIHSNGVAVMPDVHAGIGSTVGTVIATKGAIIPAAVGVDIGCGMIAVCTSLMAEDLPDSLLDLRHQIERDVPLGPGGHHAGVDRQLTTPAPQAVSTALKTRGDWIGKAVSQRGTLGSGNHFIELCLDRTNRVWVMLHSGSRGVGNMIGAYYIEQAKRLMERYFITLPDKDLAFFAEGTTEFDDYIAAMLWAQNYASENRESILRRVIVAMNRHIKRPFTLTDAAINCHHNYCEQENHFGQNLWVTRKGAVRARQGDLGIIPGSMGQRSYIVAGKSHAEAYCSCSHGAGRVMSRTAAGKRFTVDDLKAQTEGVECRKDTSVLDEIPGAYKDIDEVMANQSDLVDVVAVLKQVMCVKGG